MKHLQLLVLFLFFVASLQAQQKKTVDFIGGARSYMSNSQLSVQDSLPDTTTLKRNTGGYALIDLGVNIRPNDKTEIMGKGRHDPCVVPRAVPVIEALTALVLADFWLLNKTRKI